MVLGRFDSSPDLNDNNVIRKGHMKIFKRKNKSNNWYVYVNRKRISLGTSDERVAKQLATEMELQKLRGTLGLVCSQCNGPIHQQNNVGQIHVVKPSSGISDTQTTTTVDGFYTRYSNWREEDGITQHLKEERSVLFKKWIPFLHNSHITNINDITVQSCQDFISSLKNNGLAPKTIHTTFSMVDSSISRAVAWGCIKSNPFHDGPKRLVDLPPTKGKGCKQKKVKPRLLNNEELAVLFNHKKYGLYYEWLYYTGLRAGDVSGLLWEKVDPVNREMRVWNEKADRWQTFPLHRRLSDWAKKQKNTTGPLFPKLYAETPRQKQNKFKYAREEIYNTLIDNGFELFNDEGDKAKLHSFRASSGQAIELSGGDRKDAAKHLGHSSDKTIDEYIHQDTRVGNKMLDKVPVIKPKGVA